MKRLLIITIIISSLSITTTCIYEFKLIHLLNYNYPLSGGNIFVSLIVMVFLIRLFHKMQNIKFRDNIYLYREARLILFFWIGGFVIYLIFSAIWMVFRKTATWYFLMQLTRILTIFLTPFISTFWVMRKLKITDDESYYAIRRAMCLNVLTITRTGSKWSDITGTGAGSATLQNILQSEDMLDGYMEHLIKEFCMENLLALIEFTQFKERLMNEHDNITEETVGELLVFPVTAPKSDIVYGQECMDANELVTGATNSDIRLTLADFKRMVYRLYCKYIKVGAEFELNVSDLTRSTFNHFIFDEKTWLSEDNEFKSAKDLVKIFDISINEITVLLDKFRHRFEYEDE